MSHAVHRSIAAAASLLLVTPVVATAQLPAAGAPPVEQFFDLGAPFARYLLAGCTTPNIGGKVCVTTTVERGVEAATGAGALRAWLTGVTTTPNVWGPVTLVGFTQTGGVIGASPVGTPGMEWDFGQLLVDAAASTGIVQRGAGWDQWAPSPVWLGGLGIWMTGPGLSSCSAQQVCGTEEFAVMAVTEAAVFVTPEPGTWALLGTGLLALGSVAARRRRSA